MPSLRRRRPGGSSSRREYGSRLRTQEARQPQDRHEGCPCPTRSHTSSPQTSPAHSESVGQVVPAREGMPRMSCSLAQLLLHTPDTAQARRRTQSHGLGTARYPVVVPSQNPDPPQEQRLPHREAGPVSGLDVDQPASYRADALGWHFDAPDALKAEQEFHLVDRRLGRHLSYNRSERLAHVLTEVHAADRQI